MAVRSKKEEKVYWDVVSLLGGRGGLGSTVKTAFDLTELGDEGLKWESLDALIAFLGVAEKYVIGEILDLSVKDY